jgi:hypothetical protein
MGILPVSQKRKTLEFRSGPFLGREKPSELRFKPFLDDKNLGIPFRTILGREKSSEFRSEPVFGKENSRKSVPNHFWEQKTLKQRRLLLTAS